MKKPIALLLISIMVLMLSAFSFAGNGNSMNDKDKSSVNAFVLDDKLFITVWLDAEIGDELDELFVEVVEGEDVVKTSNDYDDFEEVEKFGTIMYMYTFDAIEYTPLDDFEVKVFVSLDDESELLLTKKVDLEDLDEDDDDEEDEDDEEDMDDDMYPAAPAVANKLLKEAGIPNRVGEKNLIALVAAMMDEDESFDGVEKDDVDEYKDAVEDFLIDQLKLMFEDENGDQLLDFVDDIAELAKPVMKPDVEKGKPEFVDDHNDDDDDEDEDDEDEDDEDEDEDEDEDDEDEDDNDENHGKGGKK